MRHHLFRIRIALLCGALSIVSGCGDESDDATPAPGATATPSPSPSPSPTSPAPSPSPSPSPSPTPSPTSSAPPVALARVGDTLRGPMACVGASLEFTGTPPRLSKIRTLASIYLANTIAINYTALDTYAITIGGTAAANPNPATKTTSATRVYDYFNGGEFGEFELYRNAATSLTNVTLGRISSRENVCFYAAGGPAAYAAPGGATTRDFAGFADGIATDDTGANYRLFQSPATVRVNYAGGTVDIRMELRGRDLPFSTFIDVPVAGSEVATGTTALRSDGTFEGTVSTPGGFTGNVRGQLYGASPTGMALAFWMRKSTVEFAVGSAGLDAR